MLVIDLEIDGFSATQRIIIEKFRFTRGCQWGIILVCKSEPPCTVKEDETDLITLCPCATHKVQYYVWDLRGGK
jgi:hypothetical protein